MTSVLLVAEQLRRRVPGGIGTYVRGLLQGLAHLEHAGADAPAVTLYASRAPAGEEPLSEVGRPVRTSAWPGPLMTRAWDAGLADVPRGFGVVHAPSLATPPARRAALVVTVHDMAWRHAPDAYPRRGLHWHEAALRRALRRAAAVVAPAAAVRDEVVQAGGRPDSVIVLPWGADHLPEPDSDGAAALLDRLGVPGTYLLSVGTLEPRKNLGRLVEAYERARPSLPEPWPLVVVGPTGWGETGSNGLDRPGVVAAGPVADAVLAALYRRARLLAYVPLLEGFGLPPLEAMRAGIPVVASPMPSTEGAAFEVDPSDVEEIAAALQLVAGEDAVRIRLVEAGRARAGGASWVDSARAHVELWERVR